MNMNNLKNTYVVRRNAYEFERRGNKLWEYNAAKNEGRNMNNVKRRAESLKRMSKETLPWIFGKVLTITGMVFPCFW